MSKATRERMAKLRRDAAERSVAPPVDRVDGHELRARPRFDNFDGFVNELSGIGDFNRDKTFGGRQGGLAFQLTLLSGVDCENRWRGSDLGARIVETLPDEMTREGWELTVQPPSAEQAKEKSGTTDAFPAAQPPAPPKVPGPIPEKDDDAQVVVEAMAKKAEELRVTAVFREALCYERAYGGAGILLGIDDGGAPSGRPVKLDSGEVLDAADARNMTLPLDEKRIRSITHLTAFRGGWDGELIAWRYYNDPRKANYGMPEIYQLRNLGVPIASPPAPGETNVVPMPIPQGPTGALIFYVHESRLLVFPGQTVSRFARTQMRGWGDSVFVRVNEILSQFGQTWGGVAILMQEWAQGVFKMDGLADLLSSESPGDEGIVTNRALMLQLTQSIARCRLIDSEEEFSREVVPLTGIAEVLEQFALRLAAGADMPLSLLMGQVKGGLGDAGNSDIRFFYDRVASRQELWMVPPLQRLYRLLFVAKDSPTKGKEPERWQIEMRPLYQKTSKEEIEERNKQADTDVKMIQTGVVTPEEIAASRYGGSKYSAETVIDLEGRKKLAAVSADKEAKKQKLMSESAKAGVQPGQLALSHPEHPQNQLPPPGSGAPEGKRPFEKGDAGWNEEDHPRGKDGKFGEGGGSGTAGKNAIERAKVGAVESPNHPGAARVEKPALAAQAKPAATVRGMPGAQLLEHAVKNGGFTLDVASQRFATKGYAVSIYQAHEKVIARKLTGADIKNYIKEKASFLKANPGAHIGLWRDEEAGKWYFDVSRITQDRGEAVSLAQAHNQEGIYSLHEGKTIITKSEAERRK